EHPTNYVAFALQRFGPNVRAGRDSGCGRAVCGVIVIYIYLRSRQGLLKFLDDCGDRDDLVVARNHHGYLSSVGRILRNRHRERSHGLSHSVTKVFPSIKKSATATPKRLKSTRIRRHWPRRYETKVRDNRTIMR